MNAEHNAATMMGNSVWSGKCSACNCYKGHLSRCNLAKVDRNNHSRDAYANSHKEPSKAEEPVDTQLLVSQQSSDNCRGTAVCKLAVFNDSIL